MRYSPLLICILMVFSLLPQCLVADKGGKCPREIKVLGALGGAFLVFASSGAFLASSTTQAFLGGKTHIGYGIFLDMEEVYLLLSEEEMELIESAKENPKEIAEMFSTKLTGDYDRNTLGHDKYIEDYGGRCATKFFDGQSKWRGVCRHKSVILTAILNKLGIQAEVQSGWVDGTNGGWHAWVYLPNQNLVIDPTENVATTPSSYNSYRQVSKRRPFELRGTLGYRVYYLIDDEKGTYQVKKLGIQ